MYGVSIDDRPDAPVGTPATRRIIAIHWEWTTEYSREEMAAALGVTPQTIRKYVNDGPTEAVEEQIADVESKVRMVAVAELKEQLKAAGHRARSAATPTEVWQGEDGDIHVRDVTDEDGEVVKRVPVPEDYDLMPDEEARYYARAEVRDILDQLTNLTGAGEPDQVEVEGSGIVIRTEATDDGDG